MGGVVIVQLGVWGRHKPPAGPGQSPGSKRIFWQQSIENWLKIRSLTSLVGKYESTYLNN